MVDNIFASNALLQRAKKKWYESVPGGTKIMQPLAYATTSNFEWYTGGSTLNVSSNEQMTSAEFEWKQCKASIVINGTDELKNSGDAQVVNMLKAEVQMAEKSLSDQLGTGLFNAGNTTNAIIGLRAMVLNSGTYGIISRTSNSWWNAQIDSTTTALSLAKAQALYGDCSVDSDRPTVIVTTQNTYDDFYALIQPQQRFGDEETVKAGFTNILWNGLPIIVDSHCPSGYLFMLNEKYISLKYQKDRNFSLTNFQTPVNQDARYAHVFWMGALTGSNCRMQGAFTALA
jgi:hypothetical protein